MKAHAEERTEERNCAMIRFTKDFMLIFSTRNAFLGLPAMGQLQAHSSHGQNQRRDVSVSGSSCHLSIHMVESSHYLFIA